ncbi:hypothetical protein NG798_10170 [Ancylothrix sp. C2]|nr:hypothetical protein [Ancylothrix sp. D3o]
MTSFTHYFNQINRKKQVIFWLLLSLIFTAIYAGIALQQAFSSEYVVQDDARVYVFWMQRFSDPSLLPRDWIANYFQSVTPAGYAALYHLMSICRIPPLLFSKILPLILGLITTTYCFFVTLELLPVPVTAFLSSLLFNQTLWLRDDLVSATPRSFISPLLLAFLYYLLRGAWLPVCICIGLMGLFYPLGVFLCAGLLIGRLAIKAIITIKNSRQVSPRILSVEEGIFPPFLRGYGGILTALTIAFIVLLPYALNQSEYGPTITANEARNWPEFLPKGRIPFFDDSQPLKFWFQGQHSGIRLSLNPPIISLAFLLPLLLRFRRRFPMVKKIRSNIRILAELVFVSLGCFFLSHALLFKLYLPSRYTLHTLPMVMSIAGAISLTIIFRTIFRWLQGKIEQQNHKKKRLSLVCLSCGFLIFASLVIFYPNLFWQKAFPKTGYVVGRLPTLYEFTKKQPKDTLIVSLANEVNNLPIFGRRSILVGQEYANPYHIGYYTRLRQKYQDLIQAQYSLDLAEVKNFITKNDVDFWLLDPLSFTAKETENKFIQQYQPAATEALKTIELGKVPALLKLQKDCAAWQKDGYVMLDAECILQSS